MKILFKNEAGISQLLTTSDDSIHHWINNPVSKTTLRQNGLAHIANYLHGRSKNAIAAAKFHWRKLTQEERVKLHIEELCIDMRMSSYEVLQNTN